jgi:hypothetical protein
MNVNSTSKRGAQDAGESADVAPVSSKETAAVIEKHLQTEPQQQYYSVLAKVVAEVSQDHAHLRSFIYEYVRTKLRKELYPQFLDGAWSEIEEKTGALEDAIDRLEAEYEQSPPLLFHSKDRLTHREEDIARNASAVAHFGMGGTTRFGAGGVKARLLLGRSNAYEHSRLPASYNGHDLTNGAVLGRHISSLLIVAGVLLAIYSAFEARTLLNRAGLHWLDRPAHVAVTTNPIQNRAPTANERPQQITRNESQPRRVGDIPVPTDYGAYAVVDGRLIELEQLAIKVPDPRVAISAAISNPGHTHLPGSPRQFVIFRKDLLNSTPERASVRVVAQVVRALTFEGNGAPKKTSIEQSWVIRNNSYPMRVGPLADNPEMIVVRSEFADLLLPAGRYVLVLKGIGYDFTIDGPVTDQAHCLERTEALNAPIYSECPKS